MKKLLPLIVVFSAGILLFAPQTTWAQQRQNPSPCELPSTLSGKLFLFSEKNCGTQTLDSPVIENKTSWHQEIRSFRVESSNPVIFHKETDFRGQSICFNGPAGISDFDFQVASITAPAPGTLCDSPGVVIEDQECGGSIGGVVCKVGRLSSTIPNAIAGAFGKVLSTAIGIVAALLNVIFTAMAGILMALIDYFLSTTVVPNGPNTPSFVTASFNMVRQWVNMFFILILVFIGLATILRIQSYQLQKTLPSLIIMALLVNFSGVFVGFIVDMSNLVAHFFLERARGDWSSVAATFNPQGSYPEKLGIQIASIIYYVVALLIYFVLILVFALRTMLLWTLTVLAPLAFASYILPATKNKIWDEWLKQLIAWSIFAIPVTFFMFLAHAALIGISNVAPASNNPDGTPSGIRFLRDFLAPFTALFILYLGVMKSQEMAPAAAKGVADFGKKIPRGLANTRLGSKVLAGFASRSQGVLGATSKLSEAKGWGKLIRPIGWAAKEANRAWGGGLLKYATKKRQFSPPPEFDQMSSREQKEFLKTRGDEGDRAKIWGRMIKNNTLKYEPEAQEIAKQDVARLVNSPYYRAEVGAWMDWAPADITKQIKIDFEIGTDAQNKMRDKIDKAEQELQTKLSADDITIEAGLKFGHITDEQVETDRANAIVQAHNAMAGSTQETEFVESTGAGVVHFRELKPQDMAPMHSKSMRSTAARVGLHKQTMAHFQRIHDNFELEVEDKVFNGTGGINKMVDTPDKADAFYWQNPALFRAFVNTPGGQQLPFEGRNQMRKMPNGALTRGFDDYREDWLAKGSWQDLLNPGPAIPTWPLETPAPAGWVWYPPTLTGPAPATPTPPGGTPPGGGPATPGTPSPTPRPTRTATPTPPTTPPGIPPVPGYIWNGFMFVPPSRVTGTTGTPVGPPPAAPATPPGAAADRTPPTTPTGPAAARRRRRRRP